jgi:arylsulfatase A-like enzyme
MLKSQTNGFLFLIIFVLLYDCTNNINKQPTEKMNILFIAVDDLKPNLGCYGDTVAISPNIDKLASEATIFGNNQCQQAVCGPSRASLLTGWRPDRTQIWDLHTLIRDKNPNVITLPQYFKNNGYQTAARGKIFDLRSVDKMHDEISWTFPYEYPKIDRWIGTEERLITQNIDLPDDKFIDGEILNQSIDLLNKMSKNEKPFFLAVGFKKPHLPFVAPKKSWDKFKRDQFKLAEFREHAKNAPEFAFQPGWELRSGYDHVPPKGPISEEMQKELIHGYYACISHTDDQIGKLLHRLDELGLRENTIIVLWGDHGWHLGDHSMWCKHTNFEQATRAPLIIHSPKLKSSNVIYSPTEFVDIFPTLCELTGLNIPENLDGKSLVPIMRKPSGRIKNYAVSQFSRKNGKQNLEGYSLRTDKYRYTVWLPSKVRDGALFNEKDVVAHELYDYEKDPLEKVNHYNEREYGKIQNKLKNYMKEYFSKRKN